MSSNKLEYDSTLGGSIVLPNCVQTYRYAAASVQEIRQLLDEVRHPTSTKLVFQTLPKHMRRRAMSHHPKRLPRKYRAIHRSQMSKAGKPQQTKRPSRKYRRKPSNLLKEYIRRQRQHTWLETHIWHAKRFHMINRWGYRLPYASCDKSYRACYRATAEHCLLQDISYYACLQFEGTLVEISAGFAKLSSSCCGLSVAAKTYLTGRREGSLELFRNGQYPEGALGRVTFLWKPLEEGESEGGKRLLWMWVHPSSYLTVLEELIKAFDLKSMKSVKVPLEQEIVEEGEHQLKETEIDDIANVPEERKKEDLHVKSVDDGNNKALKITNTKPKPAARKLQRRLQFMTRTFAHERTRRYTNSSDTLLLSELKDTMNRFRLTGPLAHSVLAHAFKTAQSTNSSNDATNWFLTQLQTLPSYQNYHQTQADFWQECANLSSPGKLLSNIVVALNIEDPRIHRPQKRSKALPKYQLPSEGMRRWLVQPPASLSYSCLWHADLRDNIYANMLSTQSYCELRAKHVVVPGAPCAFERALQPLPVILVQRPGSQHAQYKRLGYSCGWDIIAPAGYGMSIWLALIMWGAKPGGLREFGTIARELGTEEFLPDTVGGQQHFAERAEELRSKYFRLPPNKRCNYRKFSIISPFRAPLSELVRDWTPAASQISSNSAFYVLRDRKMLEQLQHCIATKNTADFPSTHSLKCLVQMQFLMKSRGNPGDFAVICMPTRNDFKRNLKLIKRENHTPVFTEPLKPDTNEKQRKLLRMEHKKLLKRLRGRRIRQKRKQQQTSTRKVHISAAGTASLVATQFKRMCELWLPPSTESFQSVRQQCAREVFGYITNCSFSYIEARVCAIGYVTLSGLQQLLDISRASRLKQPMCLLRGTNSRHYRFASFKLNLQV